MLMFLSRHPFRYALQAGVQQAEIAKSPAGAPAVRFPHAKRTNVCGWRRGEKENPCALPFVQPFVVFSISADFHLVKLLKLIYSTRSSCERSVPMNLHSLDYFLVLAREKNFTRAAEALHITQQSLSSHIAGLEKELGCTLLVRRTPLELTYAGRTFLRYAESIGDTSLQKCLERLKSWEGNPDYPSEISLYYDHAPYSFGFTQHYADGRIGIVGGLLYHGIPDRSFAVTLQPFHGWQIHT